MKNNKTQPKPTPKSGGKKPVVVKTLERRTREIALPKVEIKTKTLSTDKDMLGKAKAMMGKKYAAPDFTSKKKKK